MLDVEERRRRVAQDAENRRASLRREMVRAEDTKNVLRMRALQKRYFRETGSYFETTLAWQ